MLKVLFLTTLLSTQVAFAEATVSDCQNSLVKHLKDAIDHNKKFVNIYSEMTDEKEEIKSISYSLINMERVSVLFLSPLDKKAEIYQAKNIPVMCENVVPMSGARALRELLPEALRPKTFHQLEIKEISKKIKKLFAESKYEESYKYIAEILEDLEHYPEQLCLTRHFLESMARTILLMPKQRELALENGLEDPSFISEKFLSLQRFPLNYNYKLDKRAFQFQKEGISILCNDIPAIPWKFEPTEIEPFPLNQSVE
jgi:hypothetical protein